jgi:rhodanese-related sulfurtransferase
MADVQRIGVYQLENLIRQRVPFLYLDLRSAEKRNSEATGHAGFQALLHGSVSVAPDGVLAYVTSLGVPVTHPVVLICENGDSAVAAARTLEQNSFINVFVVEGGTQSLRTETGAWEKPTSTK